MSYLRGPLTRNQIRQLMARSELLDGLPEPLDGFEAEKRMIARVFWLFNHALHGDLPADEGVRAVRRPHRGHARSSSRSCPSAGSPPRPGALALGRWGDVERFAAIGLDADPGSQFAFWVDRR